MCRAIADGGVRCIGHLRKARDTAEAKLDDWTAKVNQRRIIVENHDTKENRRNLERAEANVETYTARLASLVVEEAEAEARRAAAEANKQNTKALKQFLACELKPEEWELIREEAKALGYDSRSQLVRKRLTGLPEIRSVEGAKTPKQEWRGNQSPYRQATQGKNRPQGYEREANGVRVDADTLERLDREAELFGISRSDYVRALMLDLDPRSLGHHIGRKKSDELWEFITVEEQGHIITAQDARTYWHNRILEVRLKHPISV